jgi:3-oxoacyl-[acyl-carrier-protein] synthase III
MHLDAFITGHGSFLPHAPVTNEQIADVLGQIGGTSDKIRRRILINNGIRTRHYAIDPCTKESSYTNAQMTALAIRALAANTSFDLDVLESLVCGTSSPDQFIPSHGSMVHAELGCPPCEVATTAGVCCAGVSALKYAYLNVASGSVRNAIVTGSELASIGLSASHFEPALALLRADHDREPMLGFSTDFLRWMLSDGAGAVLLTTQPDAHPSLRIDWIDVISFASESEVCMYYGMQKQADGASISYRRVPDPVSLAKRGFLNLSQDVAVLKERLPVLITKAIEQVKQKRQLRADRIDWLLPHYSSEWFHQPLYDRLCELGLEIPEDRWFTNLTTKGNTGSASIFIILDELLSSRRLERGQRLLCLVPESARMTFAFVHLTVA